MHQSRWRTAYNTPCFATVGLEPKAFAQHCPPSSASFPLLCTQAPLRSYVHTSTKPTIAQQRGVESSRRRNKMAQDFKTNQERIDSLTMQIHVSLTAIGVAGQVGRPHAGSSSTNPASSPSLRPLQYAQAPIVGSGFIQLPPQKRFERPLVMQPPTIAVSSDPFRARRLCKACAPDQARLQQHALAAFDVLWTTGNTTLAVTIALQLAEALVSTHLQQNRANLFFCRRRCSSS